MNAMSKMSALYRIGGAGLVTSYALDRVAGKGGYKERKYSVFKNAPVSAYESLLKDHYRLIMGEELDLDNPRTYNEKIQWLKLHDSTPIKTQLSDKFKVRSWIEEKVGGKYLVPLITVFDSSDDIEFDSLPEAFALKCNHGSGWNAIIADKNKENVELWKKQFSKWMETNYAYVFGLELQYKDIGPKIVCEELLENDIADYRVYCFGGKAAFIKVTKHNPSSKGGYDSGFYYPDWRKCEFKMIQGYGEIDMPEPQCLGELLQVAQELARDFIFVRADFYIVNNRVYFSEMTFTPNSGYERFADRQTALRFGEMIEIG